MKKIIAVILVAVLSCTALVGCSKSYTSVLTINGEEIAPNIYLLAQLESYYNALDLVEEGTKDINKGTIEGVPAVQWIYDDAVKALKNYIYTENEFEEKGLSFTQEDLEQIEASAQYMWSYVQDMYKENGVGYETYKSMLMNTYKSDRIFNNTYGVGGEKEPSDDEAKKYLEESYARIKGFFIAKLNDAGEPVAEDMLKDFGNYAVDALNELNGGADFIETQIKYMTMVGERVESENDFSNAEEYTWEEFIEKDGDKYPEEMITKLFELQKNQGYAMHELEEHFIIFQRIDNYADEEEFKSLKKSMISEMKNDEYMTALEENAAAYEVVKDEGAVKYYSVNKIKG